MSNKTVWGAILLTAITLAYMLLFMRGGFAEWKPEYAQASPEAQQWYREQQINSYALPRLQVPFKSCCDNGDRFITRFRILNEGSRYGADTYEYWREGEWRVISPDIIQHKPTPDGQPVLFIHKGSGKELCFIIDKEGI